MPGLPYQKSGHVQVATARVVVLVLRIVEQGMLFQSQAHAPVVSVQVVPIARKIDNLRFPLLVTYYLSIYLVFWFEAS